jgi:hypothetical protein
MLTVEASVAASSTAAARKMRCVIMVRGKVAIEGGDGGSP